MTDGFKRLRTMMGIEVSSGGPLGMPTSDL
jgi:hypothetical protein